MLKKIMLSLAIVVLLTGAENLFAQEKRGESGAKEKDQVNTQKRDIEARWRHMDGLRQRPQRQRGIYPGQRRAKRQQFNRLFNELTKAYRGNNRQKMGQILRKINQLRGQQPTRRGASGRAGQGFRGRGIGGPRQGFQGRGFQPRGMGRGFGRMHGGWRGNRNFGSQGKRFMHYRRPGRWRGTGW
jgi:hypothetical protein